MFEGETSMSMLKVALITLDWIKLRGPKKFQLNQQLSHKSPRSSTATHKTNIDIILSKYDIFWADTSHQKNSDLQQKLERHFCTGRGDNKLNWCEFIWQMCFRQCPMSQSWNIWIFTPHEPLLSKYIFNCGLLLLSLIRQFYTFITAIKYFIQQKPYQSTSSVLQRWWPGGLPQR